MIEKVHEKKDPNGPKMSQMDHLTLISNEIHAIINQSNTNQTFFFFENLFFD